METSAHTHWRRAFAAASVSLLLATPLLISAQEVNGRGRQIVDRIFSHLCAQGILRSSRCQPIPPPLPTLILVKTVINDDGGTATPASFQVMIDDTVVAWGATYVVSAGTHMASEMTHANYTSSAWGGDCAANGSITLGLGENKTCTITNDDNPSEEEPGRLIVNKVTQPGGHSRVFDIMATGTGTIIGGGAGTTTDAVNKEYMVMPGAYSVSEVVPSGWTQVSNTCVNVVVSEGETKTCTITNRKEPKLTVTKIVINDNGGTATSSDFVIHVHDMSGTTTVDVAGSPQPGSAAGTTYTVVPGPYHVAETGGPANYSMTVGGDCAADGSITLAAGDTKTCTVTNNDNPPQMIGHLVISEVYYDVASTTPGSESSNEWMELYNGSNATVNLQGWYVGDASSTDIISDDISIGPGEWIVVVASTTPAGIPGSVDVVVLNSSIGQSGFANGGDGARLLNPSLVVVDQVGYGTNVTVPPNVAIPGSSDGHALMRTQLTSDTNTAADWADSGTPTPGT